jgi:hypothetical protein
MHIHNERPSTLFDKLNAGGAAKTVSSSGNQDRLAIKAGISIKWIL